MRRSVARNSRLLTVGSLLTCGHQVCEASVPVLIGLVISRAVDTGDVAQLVWWMAALAVLFAVLSFSYQSGARFLMRAIASEGHQLRVDLAMKILHPWRLQTRLRSGELLSIAGTDADNTSYLLDYVPRIAGALTAIGVCAVILLTIDAPLGLVVLIGTPVSLFILQFGGPVITRRVADQQELAGKATATSADLVAGLRPLRGIGAQDAAANRYRAVSQEALTATVRAARSQSVYIGFSNAMSALLAVGVAVTAGWFALRGDISIGELITVIGLAQFLIEPFSTMAEVPSWIAEARASAERVGWVEDAPLALAPGIAVLGTGPYSLELDGVRHGPLDGATLRVEAGTIVGLVAVQSADADAIVKILSGQVPFGQYGGWIRVGGVPLQHLDLAESHRALLVEPHKTDLFTGSLRSNLVAGVGADHDQSRIDDVLRASCAIDVVDVHHDALDHAVTERGASLSGGQRQRLTLARALLRRAPVLVLHDPTTAVDSVTESAVAQGITDIRHGTLGNFTTLILTCSPALLAAADRIVLVDKGRVVASGTHTELLARQDYQAAVLR